MSRADQQMNVRVPSAVLLAVQNGAKSSGRSMSSEVVLKLCEAYGIDFIAVREKHEPTTVTSIRSPIDLLNEVKATAAANGVNLGQQIISLMRAGLSIERGDR